MSELSYINILHIYDKVKDHFGNVLCWNCRNFISIDGKIPLIINKHILMTGLSGFDILRKKDDFISKCNESVDPSLPISSYILLCNECGEDYHSRYYLWGLCWWFNIKNITNYVVELCGLE